MAMNRTDFCYIQQIENFNWFFTVEISNYL